MSKVQKKIEAVKHAMGNTFTKAGLMPYYALGKQLFLKNEELALKEGVDSALGALISSKNALTKIQVAEIAALCFASPALYQAFLALLSGKAGQVFEALVWETEMTAAQIEQELGIEVLHEKITTYPNRSYVHKELKLIEEFSLFYIGSRGYYGGYGSRDSFVLSLPIVIRQTVHQYYKRPDDANLLPIKEIDYTMYRYLSGEENIRLELPRILTYYKQGQISATKKNRPAFTTLSKMGKQLSLKEFFPDASGRKLTTLRTFLLASTVLNIPLAETEMGPIEIIQGLFNNKAQQPIVLPPLLLPDLKGMGQLDGYSFTDENHKLFLLLKQLPKGEWVAAEHLLGFVKYSFIMFKPISIHNATDKLYYEYKSTEEEAYNYTNRHHISNGYLYDRAIARSFVLGGFFFYAALGLCDLAYDAPDLENLGRTCYSSWDGLRYVRRTPLGDYVCGHSKTYEASSLARHYQLTLSPDALLIMTEEEDSASAAILDPYTEQIGANRFRTDSSIFLKNIRSKQELQAKIQLFKQVINQQLPPNWARFFQELHYKINPFEPVGKVEILKIPADNKELIRLMAQDQVLKGLAIKAEGFLLIVPKDKYGAFKKRLQEFGYLLT